MKLLSLLTTALLLTNVLAKHPVDPKSGKYINEEHLVKDSKNTDLDLDLNLDLLTGSVVNELAEFENSQIGKTENQEKGSISPFYLSISMILVSEIGDKTFLIAAIMSMRYPRLLVFSSASSALVLMTILSGSIGHIFPTLLSPKLTRSAASILFLVFGINLLRESLSVKNGQGVEEELAEVEEEISTNELNNIMDDIEKGKSLKDKQVEKKGLFLKFKNLLSLISSPIWFQIFSMTFLAEWGDRSQITTIAMAAGADWVEIMLGGSVGHIICTLLAVLCGRYISTKISIKTILLSGSIAFFIFSGLYFYAAIFVEE